MKRLALILLFSVFGLGLFAQAGSLPVRPEQLPEQKPVKYTPPHLIQRTLPNGIRVIMLPDHTLPLVDIEAVVKVGSIYEPAGKLGLAGLTGRCLETGGTKNYPADKLAEALDGMAARVSSNIGKEMGTLDMNILSKDVDKGVPMFADMLMHPVFDARKVEIERAKMMESIRREFDRPITIAVKEFYQALYGGDSPWARRTTVKDVMSIKREDMAAFHARYFHPNATILAVAGDFDPKAMEKMLTKAFRTWKKEKVDYPTVAGAPAEENPGVTLVNKPELTQTTVLVGELTAPRGRGRTFNRDVYAMDVMNFILGGGGFNSILMREIRSNRGLAYGAGSFYSFATVRGIFGAYTQTGVKTTAQASALMKQAFERMASKPPTADELKIAKDNLINKFVFNYQTASQIADRAAHLEFYGYPADYMATYTDHISKVTPADCRKVAEKYLHPDKMSWLVLGPADALKQGMGKLGEVSIKPLPKP
jgi:zinc protease